MLAYILFLLFYYASVVTDFVTIFRFMFIYSHFTNFLINLIYVVFLFCSLICLFLFQLKFDDLVLTSKEVKAFSLEQFLFDNSVDVDESDVPLDDDFVNSPSRRPIPKAVSPSVHRSKVAQQSSLSLEPLIDRVNQIEKNQQTLSK